MKQLDVEADWGDDIEWGELFLSIIKQNIYREYLSWGNLYMWCLFGYFQAWGEKVLQKEDKFREMQKYKIELDRKIGQKVDDDIVTSVTGTFRKLNVD